MLNSNISSIISTDNSNTILSFLQSQKTYSLNSPPLPSFFSPNSLSSKLDIDLHSILLSLNSLLQQRLIVQIGSQYAFYDEQYWDEDFGYTFNDDF
jgi:hypothetical protein